MGTAEAGGGGEGPANRVRQGAEEGVGTAEEAQDVGAQRRPVAQRPDSAAAQPQGDEAVSVSSAEPRRLLVARRAAAALPPVLLLPDSSMPDPGC